MAFIRGHRTQKLLLESGDDRQMCFRVEDGSPSQGVQATIRPERGIDSALSHQQEAVLHTLPLLSDTALDFSPPELWNNKCGLEASKCENLIMSNRKCRFAIPAPRRLSQENQHKFEVNLGYVASKVREMARG